MIDLIQAPHGCRLKIAAILGGEAVRRRLFALGFHKGDLVEIQSQGILRGPFLVKNLTAGTSVALGRGVAQKIQVDILADE
jgi:Fe2+ transport system protein FeoA